MVQQCSHQTHSWALKPLKMRLQPELPKSVSWIWAAASMRGKRGEIEKAALLSFCRFWQPATFHILLHRCLTELIGEESDDDDDDDDDEREAKWGMK